MYPNCYSGPATAYPAPYSGQSLMPTAVQLPNQLRCKYINGLEDVTPNDVPMDGSSSFFPLNDGSTIYVKRWNSDGTIKTVKYTRDAEEPEVKKSLEDTINERFDEIVDILKKNRPSNNKRGEADNNA